MAPKHVYTGAGGPSLTNAGHVAVHGAHCPGIFQPSMKRNEGDKGSRGRETMQIPILGNLGAGRNLVRPPPKLVEVYSVKITQYVSSKPHDLGTK